MCSNKGKINQSKHASSPQDYRLATLQSRMRSPIRIYRPEHDPIKHDVAFTSQYDKTREGIEILRQPHAKSPYTLRPSLGNGGLSIIEPS